MGFRFGAFATARFSSGTTAFRRAVRKDDECEPREEPRSAVW